MDWTYCKDKPPDKSGDYLVIKEGFGGDYYHVTTASYSTNLYKLDNYDFYKYRNKKNKSGWYDYDSEYGYYKLDDVVAWMKKPEIPEELLRGKINGRKI